MRITHLPTGIVVACQAERSQHKNRATAWNMLRARLYERELEKREAKATADAASKTDIGWGHQIRSYVLQPYQMVKDLRTGHVSGSPADVLDGDLDPFMEASLAQRLSGRTVAVEDVESGISQRSDVAYRVDRRHGSDPAAPPCTANSARRKVFQSPEEGKSKPEGRKIQARGRKIQEGGRKTKVLSLPRNGLFKGVAPILSSERVADLLFGPAAELQYYTLVQLISEDAAIAGGAPPSRKARCPLVNPECNRIGLYIREGSVGQRPTAL